MFLHTDQHISYQLVRTVPSMYLIALHILLILVTFILVPNESRLWTPWSTIFSFSRHSDHSNPLPQTSNATGEVDSSELGDSDDESTSSEDTMDDDHPDALARSVILDYFTRTGVHRRFRNPAVHSRVEEQIRSTITSWNLNLPERSCQKYIRTALDMVGTGFRYIESEELQVQIGFCTFFTAVFDDGVVGLEAMNEMVPRYHARKPQLHPALQCFVDTMTYEMRKHFSTYSANAIATSFLDYANAELLLRESKDMQLKPSSSTYIEYIRLREGFSEAWAAFIWPESMCPDPKEYVQAFPDAMNFIDLINDIFSYYKEAKAGETTTYVNSYATVHGQNIPQAMRSLVEQTVMVVNRIRDLLGEGRARDAWENFAAGYTQFHLLTPRYRLAEVLPEFF